MIKINLYRRLKPDFEFSDARGSLTQLVSSGYTQVNILHSKKDTVRGGHYHKISTEAFYVVSGSTRVIFKRNDITEEAVFQTGDFFSIAPYTVHQMEFSEACTLVAMYDIPVEKQNGEKDIYAENG